MTRGAHLFGISALALLTGSAQGPVVPAAGQDGAPPAEEVSRAGGEQAEETLGGETEVGPEETETEGTSANFEDVARGRIDRPLYAEDIAASLTALARAHPRLTVLESIGVSDQGREIQVLTITDPETGPAAVKPGLLAAGFEPPGTTAGAEAVLAFGWTLLERAEEDPEVALLLQDHAVLLAPALDPDARAENTSDDFERGSPVSFDRNFPLGWQPDTLRPGSGAFPLSKRETLAVAEFLDRHPTLVLIVGGARAASEGSRPWAGAELPQGGRERP